MTSHHSTELDSDTTDSVTSTPPSSVRMHDDPCLRFMCSFGGKILPRPHDNQLRYVGGDTRIVAVNRHTNFSSLLEKLSRFFGTTNISVKYQLPNEDLDALITIANDEDVEIMVEEYGRLVQNHTPPHSKMARLRLFLFLNDSISRTSSISSLLNGSADREHWFFDALNGGMGPALERGRSEVSSILSEVPDYLFGLDNSDDSSKMKVRPVSNDNKSASDPGSPTPIVSSPFCSTSTGLGPAYVPVVPDTRPVKAKSENPVPISDPKPSLTTEVVTEMGETIILQPPGFVGNSAWQIAPGNQYPSPTVQTIPVYYIPGTVPLPGNVGVQQVPIGAQYIPQVSAPSGHIPGGIQQVPGMGQVFAREVRSIPGMDPYDTRRVISGGLDQPVYYEMRNTGMVPMYAGTGMTGMAVSGGDDPQGKGNDSSIPGRDA